MKKSTSLFLVSSLFLLTQFSLSISQINTGFAMGGMYPDSDSIVQGTFGKNFYWQGFIGLLDSSGLEVRGTLGHYGDTSHNSADLGTNFRVGIFPLTASLIYHINNNQNTIQPYLGGGVGGYFYDFRDDIFGELESGIRFGFHAVGGLRINLSKDSYLMAEYKKHFIPSLFFNNASNFNTSELTIGMGFLLPFNSDSNKPNNYKYTDVEEDLLVQIQQCQIELVDLETQKETWQKEIDEFYLKSDYNTSSEFSETYQSIKFKESQLNAVVRQIDLKKNEISLLKKKWIAIQPDTQPVEQHIVYLERNYIYSPYGLHNRNNILIRHNRPFRRSTQPVIIVNPHNDPSPSEKVEERKEFAQKKKERLLNLKNRT